MKRIIKTLSKYVFSNNETNRPTASTLSIDPKVVGFADANHSGFYQANGELAPGLKIGEHDIVLDVGCGGGLATHFCALQGAHVIFTDVDREKIQSLSVLLEGSPARKVEGLVSDTIPLPLPDEHASIILAMEVLEHTRSPRKILRELIRVGHPNARYFISVPEEKSETVQEGLAPAGYFKEPNHIQRFSKDNFLSLVEGEGLIVERYFTWGFFWTMWWCLRWLEELPELRGEVLELIQPPYSEATDAWVTIWHKLMTDPRAFPLVDELNKALPKSQGVIARKPG